MKASNLITAIIIAISLTLTFGAKVKVAVYEHSVISPDDANLTFTREEAFSWMLKNLKVLREQASVAAHKEAKIIVFPEYGVTGFDQSRDSMVPFLEDIPDVTSHWTPCDQPDRFPDTSVLRHLSCTAKNADIYVVVNIGDIKYCDRQVDWSCPSDGRFQFNTNVVFDNKGKLIARYHKRNLYDESPLFDPAPTNEYVYFDTPFGRFGTVVCFDILHYFPTQVLLNKYQVQSLLVTSAWNVMYPFVLPIQMFAGLAKRNHINVIASNVRHEEYFMASSGIFGPGVEISSSTNFTRPGGELIIAGIDTLPEVSDKMNRVKSLIKLDDMKGELSETFSARYDYGMDVTGVILSNNDDFVAVCRDAVCCAVKYKFSFHDETEVFILTASDYEMTIPGAIHFQFCAVHRCAVRHSSNAKDMTSCGGAFTHSNSTFSFIQLQGFFDTSGVVFPILSSSPFGNLTYYSENENYIFDRENAVIQSDSIHHSFYTAAVFNTLYVREAEKVGSGSSHASRRTYLSIILVFMLVCI